MSKIHYISSKELDFDTIQNITNQNFELALSDEAKQNILKCRDYLDKKMENYGEAIYGITTGFGALHNVTISKDELSQLQTNLVKSHACGIGDEVDARENRTKPQDKCPEARQEQLIRRRPPIGPPRKLPGLILTVRPA